MKPREVLPVCFVLLTALLVWPLLGIANRRMLVGGVPALVAYLFAVWAIVVAVLGWAAWRARGEEQP